MTSWPRPQCTTARRRSPSLPIQSGCPPSTYALSGTMRHWHITHSSLLWPRSAPHTYADCFAIARARPAHSRPWCTAAASKMSVQYCCLTAPWPRALERSGNNVQRDRARPHCQAPPNRADVRRRRGGVQARQGHCSAIRDRARWLRWRHNAGHWAAVHVGADVMITKPGLGQH